MADIDAMKSVAEHGSREQELALLDLVKQLNANYPALEPAQRSDMLERVRTQISHASDGAEVLELLCELIIRYGEVFELQDAKTLLRTLVHRESPHPALEALLCRTLDTPANLTGYKITALGACGGPAALDLLESLPAQEYSLFVQKQLSTAIARLKRHFSGGSELRWGNLSMPRSVLLRFRCVEGAAPLLARQLREQKGLFKVHPLQQPQQAWVDAQLASAHPFHPDVLRPVRIFQDVSFHTGLIMPSNKVVHELEPLSELLLSGALPGVMQSITSGDVRFAVRFEADRRPSSTRLARFARHLESELNRQFPQSRWINEPRSEDWVFCFQQQSAGLDAENHAGSQALRFSF